MADRSQHDRRTVAVLDVGAMHDQADHETERSWLEPPARGACWRSQRRGVGEDVALAALDLLVGIEAADTATLGRLNALTVDYACGGACLATFQITGCGDEVMVDPAQDAAVAPVVKVALHSRSVRELLGQKRPGAAAGRQIQDRVQHLPQIGRPRSSDRAWAGRSGAIRAHSRSVSSLE